MSPVRPISRLSLVLPGQVSNDAKSPIRPLPTFEVLADRIAEELEAHGVLVWRHVIATPLEGASRADVALWFPDGAGAVRAPEVRDISARVHALFATHAEMTPSVLDGFDAILLAHNGLRAPVEQLLEELPDPKPSIDVLRLPISAPPRRDVEKAARGFAQKTLVVVDLRHSFEARADRMIFQLALAKEPAEFLLLVPPTDRCRARVRLLCERHELNAYLASGTEALLGAAACADLFVGHPDWVELLWLAIHRVPVGWLDADDAPPAAPWISALVEEGGLLRSGGVLQLGAFVDQRLADLGGLQVSGTLAASELIGDGPAFLECLGRISPRALSHRHAGAWEPVGPHAEVSPALGGPPTISAKTPHQEAVAENRGEEIEDALNALKARIQAESDAKEPPT